MNNSKYSIVAADINVLIAFEHSRTLANQFESKGFNVTSCDLKPSLSPGNHYQGNVLDIVPGPFHVLIGFPPCTFLARAGLHHCNSSPGRLEKRDKALSFFDRILSLPIPFIALENPIGHLNSHYKQPNQIVSPYYFGDPYRKEICLWLKGLPPLMSLAHSPGRRHVSNHVNGRMSQDLKSEIKSSWKYYPKMAASICDQWSFSILKDFNSNMVLRNQLIQSTNNV